jgi:hypothetical protein
MPVIRAPRVGSAQPTGSTSAVELLGSKVSSPLVLVVEVVVVSLVLESVLGLVLSPVVSPVVVEEVLVFVPSLIVEASVAVLAVLSPAQP